MKSICGLVLLSACAGASVGVKDQGTGETGFTETGSGGGCDTPTTWYQDSDGDGFGDASSSSSACDAPESTVADATDCDDGNALVYPGAPEVCNDGRSNDCEDTEGTEAAAACPGDGPYSLSGSDALYTGTAYDMGAGNVVAGAGDVDGDGRTDLLISAPYWGPGVVYLVLGGVTGVQPLIEAHATMEVTDVDYIQVGRALSSAGDMDGDGLPDIVVGAPDPGGVTSGAGEGTVYLVSGLVSGAVDLADADGMLSGEERMSHAGISVAGVGDVDGDGWEDVLVGALWVDGAAVESDAGYCPVVDDGSMAPGQDAGAAYFVSGPVTGSSALAEAEAKLLGEDSADGAGATVARADDLDGDGLSDLLVSAVHHCAGGFDAGAVYAVLGPVSGTGSLADADGKRVGEGMENRLGEALSSAGDVDGDGTPDMLIGAPNLDGPDTVLQGRAYLVEGPALGIASVTTAVASFSGESEGFYGGLSVSSAGDLDGDGFDDLLIGSMLYGADRTYPGAAYVIFGPVSGSQNLEAAPVKFTGSDYALVGSSVAGVGDTNLDGAPDLLIGIPGSSLGDAGEGAAALILGGGPAFTGTWGP